MFRKTDQEEEQRRMKELVDRFTTEALERRGERKAMTFAEIEEMSHEISREVSRRLSEHLLEEQAEPLGQEQPCPRCGRLCRVARHPRQMMTPDGPVTYAEPACHCTSCRVDFFSSP